MTEHEKITSITQIRSMSAEEVAEAHRSGRIDMEALSAEHERHAAAERERVARIRQAFVSGSLSVDDAQRQLQRGGD